MLIVILVLICRRFERHANSLLSYSSPPASAALPLLWPLSKGLSSLPGAGARWAVGATGHCCHPFPFLHTALLLFFTSLTWPDRLEKLPWGLGGDPAHHGAPDLLEAAFLPEQELIISVGRAQHCHVESRGEGKEGDARTIFACSVFK